LKTNHLATLVDMAVFTHVSSWSCLDAHDPLWHPG
jgi:hypothetical protein